MELLDLDEVTRKCLNELTREEVSRSVSYAYEHELLWYGIDAVVHSHLMLMAQDISNGTLSNDKFIEKYGLDFDNQNDGFFAPLERIESNGIFIPQQAYWDEEGKRCDRRIHFFYDDYVNRVLRDGWVDKEYAMKLIRKKWQPSDLENRELVEQGIKFGRDMWKTCVEGFYRVNRKYPQPQKVTDFAEKLMTYYSALVF